MTLFKVVIFVLIAVMNGCAFNSEPCSDCEGPANHARWSLYEVKGYDPALSGNYDWLRSQGLELYKFEHGLSTTGTTSFKLKSSEALYAEVFPGQYKVYALYCSSQCQGTISISSDAGSEIRVGYYIAVAPELREAAGGVGQGQFGITPSWGKNTVVLVVRVYGQISISQSL